MSTSYLTNAVSVLAGGFLVVASQTFEPNVIGWLAVAIGIGVVTILLFTQLDGSRSGIQRLHDVAGLTVAALLIAFGVAFGGQTVRWLTFALALGLVGICYSGLTVHEIQRWRAQHGLSRFGTRGRAKPEELAVPEPSRGPAQAA